MKQDGSTYIEPGPDRTLTVPDGLQGSTAPAVMATCHWLDTEAGTRLQPTEHALAQFKVRVGPGGRAL